MSWLIMLVLLFLLNLVSSDINQGQFSFDGYLNVDGVAGADSSGLFKLTNFTRQTEGHIFYKNPIQFKNSTNAFVVSPNNGIPGALPSQYLGLFNQSNNGFSSSTGSVLSSHYVLAWSFKMNGSAEELDLSHLPKVPRFVNDNNRGIKQLKKILAIAIFFTGLTLVLVLVFRFVLISRKKRFMEILED
ncbi:hypothetical protein Goklo_021680 [Gossypium klotzschianum]|uniref:Legume lectin domain-containing protein n=1 Tax=Gossypium klotzschianum TaxID=34286 RepID=A0A7J8UWY7_9ROSI|nr:hypothetical protein [Gossypium klotzschianum]